MKKTLLSVFILLSSFFFLSSKVNADTFDLQVSDTSLNYVNSDSFTLIKNNTLSYIENNSNANYYIIYFNSSIQQVNGKYTNVIDYSKIYSKIFTSQPSNIPYFYYSANDTVDNRVGFTFGSTSVVKSYQIDTTTLTISDFNLNSLGTFNFYFSNDIFNYTILDTNFTSLFSYNNTNNLFILNDIATIGVGYSIPTLSQLVPIIPPTPPDDTPLLTSFIDISIEKLSLICDFFTSNYIYLIPFVIFIFYFIILLFRRLR